MKFIHGGHNVSPFLALFLALPQAQTIKFANLSFDSKIDLCKRKL